jgi:carboxynorspermidine decarboxylase
MDLQKLHALPTPAYLIDEAQLLANGKILQKIQDHTGCKILLAQKAFSAYDLYPSAGTIFGRHGSQRSL